MLQDEPYMESINRNLDKEAKEQEVPMQHKKRAIHPLLLKKIKVLQESNRTMVPMMQESSQKGERKLKKKWQN